MFTLTDKRAAKLKLRDRRGSSQIAEFIPVLFILFLIFLMPMLDLANAFVAGAIQYLATNDIAAKAATQADYNSALNSMTNEAYQFQSTSLAQFVRLAPAGGYTGCGDDMYVLITNTGTGKVSSSAPNEGLAQPINTASNMYEISVKSSYSVNPLVSLATVPFIGDIPGLGKPMQLAFCANRPVEHPGGLQSGAGGATGGTSGNGIAQFPRVASSTTSSAASSSTWRTPNIYSQIQAAGETVVSDNVIMVPAMQAYLGQPTPTGLSIAAGEQIWIDTQAVGTWETAPSFGTTDANGYPNQFFTDAVSPSIIYGSLLGEVGTGAAFLLGDDQYNFPPVGTGPLYLLINQCEAQYMNGIGSQKVRVIVTR